jgi:nitroreductase
LIQPWPAERGHTTSLERQASQAEEKFMTTSRRRFLKGGAALGGGLLASRGAAAAPANETLRTIASLRTIHGDFSDREIPDGDIDQILAATVRAASAAAMQSYSIVVVRDRETQRKLSGFAGSCTLVYFLDYNRSIATAKRLKLEFAPNDMEWFVTGSTNTMLAAQTAVIAAKSMGIDSLLTNGVHRGDMERLWQVLGVPRQYCFPLIALVLGYAAKEPAIQKGRLSGPGIVHRGAYHNLTAEEADTIVRQYDDKTLNLGLVDDWNKEHKHYLEWLHKTWLGRNRTAGRTQIAKRIRLAGFEEPAG